MGWVRSFLHRMGTLLFLLMLVAPFSQVFASIGSVFPSTGFTAPIPGFPSATFPLLQYDSLAKDGSKGAKEATEEASGGDAKAASITFSNLRNFSFQNNSVEEDKQSDEVTETSANLDDLESTTTDDAEVETSTNNYLVGRDEKSLIGTFPFIDQRSGNHHHHQQSGHSQGNGKHHKHSHRDNAGQVYGEHVALSNTIDLGQVKKFEVIHELAQQGGKEEVKDGRRCVNKVNLS